MDLMLRSLPVSSPMNRLTPDINAWDDLPLIEAVRKNGSRVKGIKWIGVMADLVPLDQIR